MEIAPKGLYDLIFMDIPMPVMNGYEATAVCDCFGFYNRADRSASYPDCNGTYSHSALVGNPVYLGRILSNIMDNAIKFSQAGSVLMVGVKEEFLPLTVTRSKFLCVTDNSAANSLTMSILEIALLYSTKA